MLILVEPALWVRSLQNGPFGAWFVKWLPILHRFAHHKIISLLLGILWNFKLTLVVMSSSPVFLALADCVLRIRPTTFLVSLCHCFHFWWQRVLIWLSCSIHYESSATMLAAAFGFKGAKPTIVLVGCSNCWCFTVHICLMWVSSPHHVLMFMLLATWIAKSWCFGLNEVVTVEL